MAGYSTGYVENVVAAKGLSFDWEGYGAAATTFAQLGLTQEQHDKLIELHADIMVKSFEPTRYGWIARALIALHFLGFINLINFAKRKAGLL